jgi:hypothetical protein
MNVSFVYLFFALFWFFVCTFVCLYCCCLLSSCFLYQNLSSVLGSLFLPHWGMFYSVCVISWTGFNFYFLNSEDFLLNSLCMFQKHSVFSVNHSSLFGCFFGGDNSCLCVIFNVSPYCDF